MSSISWLQFRQFSCSSPYALTFPVASKTLNTLLHVLLSSDNAAKISMDNLKQACKDANVKFSKEELQYMMVEADLNGDGYVDQEEFIKIMLQTNLF